MRQPSLFSFQALTVSDITRYLRELMDSDEILRDVWVRGEISTLSRPSSGHIYFTLKDTGSTLKCVVWKMTAARLPVFLQSGMAVEVHGGISVYERDGQYQLYVDAVRMSGEGALYQEFLRLKARLDAEGLFDPARRREIPAVPQRIGIVTSPTGAALQDILNTLRRRYPLAEVLIAPSAVQGEEAAPDLVDALKKLDQKVDVIILARGGGSLEDLWAFNDERVVRAVAASSKPVVTGIGHETDFTLSDFAADLRAPTPTAAAELCTPDKEELRAHLQEMASRLENALHSDIMYDWTNLLEIKHKLSQLSPMWLVRNDRQRLDEMNNRLEQAAKMDSRGKRSQILNLQGKLSALNPFAVLERGYAIVSSADGKIVSSVKKVKKEDALQIKLADGTIQSQVTDIRGGM